MTARLECKNLTGGRGPATAFRDINLNLDPGTILAILGPNGAGKSTLLLTLAGLLPAHHGTITIDGKPQPNGNATTANHAGIILVPDNRSLFTTLTVQENLDVARNRNGPTPQQLLNTFPALQKRWHLRAGDLSGGEQQMLAMARALIQQPKLLLIDEMSMGLAPRIVETLFDTVHQTATNHNTTIILVEQHINLALNIAHQTAILNRGTIVLHDQTNQLHNQTKQLEHAYFGHTQPSTTGRAGTRQGR